MGTHGRGFMSHLLMGSVAEKVVRIAPCPVLTVRHPEHEFILPDALQVVEQRPPTVMSAAAPAGTAVTTRLVLRDGSTAGVRLSSPSDHDAMRRFFDELSPQARRLRFLAPRTHPKSSSRASAITRDPQKALTLIVCRLGDGGTHIIGVGSYFAHSDNSAEVAFAVDDDFHGKGIATALLERLARAGADHDVEYFSAYVLPENFEMLDVFRDSGFEVHSTTEGGTVEVRLSLQTSPDERGGGG